MRGEYEQQPCSQVLTMELPPRARRIRDFSDLLHHYLGTTSACAENTDDHASEACHTRNYLRVRGEYSSNSRAIFKSRELPPRARRILREYWQIVGLSGTTSACAENTRSPSPPAPPTRNYLRVRGEYDLGYPQERVHKELPPRARRIRCASIYPTSSLGTTSACAENTSGGGVVPPG